MKMENGYWCKAFESYLPEEVVCVNQEQFSDGVGIQLDRQLKTDCQ